MPVDSSFQYHMTMAPASDRKRSTLAANRAIAATRPIPIAAAKLPVGGRLSVQEIARELALRPVARGATVDAAKTLSATGGGAVKTPVAPTHKNSSVAAKAKPMGKAKPGRESEQRIVFTVVVCFLFCVTTLTAVRLGDNMQASKAKVAIEATFKNVHQQQQNFRVLTSRFATWNELAEAGATLPADQGVAASNADASHWYLSLRDLKTGVVCDRTGELYDVDGDERKPVCRSK